MNKFILLLILLFVSYNLKAGSSEESVFIQTDRDIYIAGEYVLFSLHVSSTDSAFKSNACYLLLRDQKNVYNKLFLKVNDRNCHGSFYLPDTLQTGYYEIVGFTNYMKNFDESYFYKKYILIVNRFDEKLQVLHYKTDQENYSSYVEDKEESPLEIILNKDNFKVRDKVEITIKPKAGVSYFNNVSVSVKELNSCISQRSKSNKNLTSENLKLFPKLKYLRETGGVYLNGYITTSDSLPVKNECLYLSTPDSIANLQYTFSNENGEFQFLLTDYYLEKQLIISTRETNRNKYVIRLEDKFQLSQPLSTSYIGLTNDHRQYILESQKLVTIQKAYSFNYVQSENLKYIAEIPYVYTNATSVIYPSNYLALKNLKEIADNIVPDVRIKKVDNDLKPFLFNKTISLYFQQPATIFVNGVPVYDLNNLMNWTSEEIRKIEVSKTYRVKGNIAFSGIIHFVTAQHLDPAALVPGNLSFKMSTFSHASVYNPPRYSNYSQQDPVPDFRQLLYWNPALEIKEHGNHVEFYTSDWTGEYLIEITGIKDGDPVHMYSKIKVYE